MDRLPIYLQLSEAVPGWTRGDEAEALARQAWALPADAVIVEIGAFVGSGTILLAGARKLQRSGIVHAVDPFDGSGDDFSTPHYAEILGRQRLTPLQQFQLNLRRAGLSRWAQAHAGTAEAIASGWDEPIDLLFLDGDQSPEGADAAFVAWAKWLRPGAVVALHNSNQRAYAPTHDGHYRLRQKLAADAGFEWLQEVGSTNFFRCRPGAGRRAPPRRATQAAAAPADGIRRDRSPQALLAGSGLFDAAYYRGLCGLTAGTDADALAHFCDGGWQAGRCPNPYFDPAWYTRTYADWMADGENPLVHYLLEGEAAGAWPSVHFDPAWYRDVRGLPPQANALAHYLAHRVRRGLSPLPSFSSGAYLLRHPSLRPGSVDLYLHDLAARAVASPAATPSPAEPPWPSWQSLVDAVGGDGRNGTLPATITPQAFVGAVSRLVPWLPFDAAWYRATYPDVDAAVRGEDPAAAWQHFVEHGYFEGRVPADHPSPPGQPAG